MPKTPKTEKAAPALPSIDAIESVAPTALPESTRGTMSDDERKLAEAVIAAATTEIDGVRNSARGPALADRKDAASAAARIKRLVGSYWRQTGVVESERPTVKTSVVPHGIGFAWVIKIIAVEPIETDAAPADAE